MVGVVEMNIDGDDGKKVAGTWEGVNSGAIIWSCDIISLALPPSHAAIMWSFDGPPGILSNFHRSHGILPEVQCPPSFCQPRMISDSSMY